jgi:hypothetical protein
MKNPGCQNNSELQTKEMKRTLKIFEENIRRGRNMLMKAELVTNDDDGDDDDDDDDVVILSKR